PARLFDERGLDARREAARAPRDPRELLAPAFAQPVEDRADVDRRLGIGVRGVLRDHVQQAQPGTVDVRELARLLEAAAGHGAAVHRDQNSPEAHQRISFTCSVFRLDYAGLIQVNPATNRTTGGLVILDARD